MALSNEQLDDLLEIHSMLTKDGSEETGYVTQDGALDFLKSLGKETSPESIEKLFVECNKAEIFFIEFLQLIDLHQILSLQELKLTAHLRKLFRKLGENQESLNKEQLRKVLVLMLQGHPLPDDLMDQYFGSPEVMPELLSNCTWDNLIHSTLVKVVFQIIINPASFGGSRHSRNRMSRQFSVNDWLTLENSLTCNSSTKQKDHFLKQKELALKQKEKELDSKQASVGRKIHDLEAKEKESEQRLHELASRLATLEQEVQTRAEELHKWEVELADKTQELLSKEKTVNNVLKDSIIKSFQINSMEESTTGSGSAGIASRANSFVDGMMPTSSSNSIITNNMGGVGNGDLKYVPRRKRSLLHHLKFERANSSYTDSSSSDSDTDTELPTPVVAKTKVLTASFELGDFMMQAATKVDTVEEARKERDVKNKKSTFRSALEFFKVIEKKKEEEILTARAHTARRADRK